MTIEYDEKGKFYTDIVTKVAVPTMIQTTNHLIRGLVHVRQGERLKDEMEGQEHFTAVTNAIVYDGNEKVLFSGPFLAVSAQVVVKIEIVGGPNGTTIRLVGRLSMEHLPLLIAKIDAAQDLIILEMDEVTLVDTDVVRFLIDCQTRGIQLRGCSAYIRAWIAREQKSGT